MSLSSGQGVAGLAALVRSKGYTDAFGDWAARRAEVGRRITNPRTLRRIAKGCMARFVADGCRLSMLFPAVGIALGAWERGAWASASWWSRQSIRVWLWYMQRLIRGRELAGRPGWNDFYMTLWMMTGEARYVEELYRRAVTTEGLSELVTMSCRWMLSSVRDRFRDLNAALCELEAKHRHGIPLSL